jgi:2-hydroxycyclohexanecarboxyl-CoA dehydrogenase
MTTNQRTVVITGAGSARGIGRATASLMARQGWSLALLDVDAAGVENAAGELRATGAQARAFPVDLTDEAAVDATAAALTAEMPSVAAVVNNAGISTARPFLEISSGEWENVFDVNVKAQFLLTRALLPGMLERRHGRVVVISSAAGQRGGGYFGGVHYSASKAALLGFTKALAREHSAAGVTFNAVAPGAIDTDITAGHLTDDRRRTIESATPVGRLGKAEEVASLVAFLCHDDSGFITGATYDINGGSHIH